MGSMTTKGYSFLYLLLFLPIRGVDDCVRTKDLVQFPPRRRRFFCSYGTASTVRL